MITQKYRKYYFTKRAIGRLLGENKSSISYRIKRLCSLGAINKTMYQKVFRRRLEGDHYVMRWVDTYDIYALRILAESYDTKRAESVAKRCADIMLKNLECDYSDIIQHFID